MVEVALSPEWSTAIASLVQKHSSSVSNKSNKKSTPSKSSGASSSTTASSRPPVVVVCGPRGVGKSTFVQALRAEWKVSRLLETDIGRPESLLPGFLSLTDAENNVTAAEFFGEDQPGSRPNEFLSCVRVLAARAAHESTPLVVNTMGWISGMGQDLLEALIEIVQATTLVQIIPKEKLASLGTLLRPAAHEARELITVYPAVEHRSREGKEARDRKTVKFFEEHGKSYRVPTSAVTLRVAPGLLGETEPDEAYLKDPDVLEGAICGVFLPDATYAGAAWVTRYDAEDDEIHCRVVLQRELSDADERCSFLVGSASVRPSSLVLSTSLFWRPSWEDGKHVSLIKAIGLEASEGGSGRQPVPKRRRLESDP